jgi:biotin-(acetyl-CoA carboxylase) ligase
MKTIFLNSVLLILFSTMMSAQEKEDNSPFKNYSASVFNSKAEGLIVVSKLEQNKTNNSVLNQNYAGILIQQIGDYNAATAIINGNSINVNVSQEGTFNELLLNKDARSINQSVLQQGKNNEILDYSFSTNYGINMQMIQKGNDQSIQSYGTNSISKDMKVTQSGNGASVIILNKLN